MIYHDHNVKKIEKLNDGFIMLNSGHLSGFIR